MSNVAPTSEAIPAALRDAFDRGARRYDLLVALNPGYHRHLRSAAGTLIERVGSRPAPAIVDLACGSGASTRALLKAVPDANVLGIDASAGMLQQAQRKPWPVSVRFEQGESGRLDVDAVGREQWNGVFASYLFRNVAAEQRDAAVKEVFDIVRPGGWLVTQDYSVAGNERAARRWDLVCSSIIVPLARLVDGDTDLYRYLQQSAHDFDSVQRFSRRLADAGFVDVWSRTVRGWQNGILHTFAARKPAAE